MFDQVMRISQAEIRRWLMLELKELMGTIRISRKFQGDRTPFLEISFL